MGTPIEALLSGLIVALTSWLPLNPEANWVSPLVEGYSSFLVPAYLGVTFAVLFRFRERFSRLLLEAMKGIYEAELKYLFFATLFTVLIGLPASRFSCRVSAQTSALLNITIGGAIILLAVLNPAKNPLKELDRKLPEQPSILDSLSAGILQGFALLGPLTRTGTVTLGLLLPGHSAKKALQWGFMVAPAYLILRLVQFGSWQSSDPAWVPFTAFASAFFGSLLLMPLLERMAERNGRYFLISFGLVAVVVYALEVVM
ncbi:undecaprenyl-diphosphate phosphatase [Thermococcus sp.]|uniref:undecaprenyl-diphosphate phosphatase n=1 Tax=Thermococcus sp. TaxID=35749 RepID=UPI002630EA1D|nr:undecaprenyl-diphosphate phosphatase [Thermococcus sp.]